MSTPPERILEQVFDMVRRMSADARQRARRRRKRRRRAFLRFLKVTSLLALASFVIVFGMILSGRLLGPRGDEGMVATPLALLAAWSAILYFVRASRASTRPIVKADLAQLPARTEEWLEQARRALPSAAQQRVDGIVLRLEALAPQLSGLDPNVPAAAEVRRLIGEELPELVRGYQKVPRALQRQPLHGGPSPDHQLVEGLTTIEREIDRMHARLAAEDLHALATQQRYLEIKYKRDDKIE